MKNLFLIFMAICCLLIFPSVANAKSPTVQYSVGIDDVISIVVIDRSDLKTVTTVAIDGSITFPYIGTLYVKGLKLSEIKNKITKKLSKYIKYPVVSVSLVNSKSRKIFIYGEVVKPGEYMLGEEMTVVKAISVAGGIRPGGLYGKVKVRRVREGKPGYRDIKINLKSTIEGTTRDMLLQPDDIVIVERNKNFFIYGELARPGEYMLEDNMTVVKAISIAGGITHSGLYGKVKIRRKQDGKPGYKDIEIDIKSTIERFVIEGSTPDMLLEPDDVVIVERNKKFFIYGEVARPGGFTLEDDMTVLRAISLAGGFTKWGSPGRVKVLRLQQDKADYETIKVNVKAAIDGDARADIALQPGDVVVVSERIF